MWIVGAASAAATSLASVVLPAPLGPSMTTRRVVPHRGSLAERRASTASTRFVLGSAGMGHTLGGYAFGVSVAIRVIPCLDVDAGRVVKGVNFVDLRDAGDPVEQAKAYDLAGADELCFLDISASHEGRGTLLDIVSRTAAVCFMPLTVGGGVRSV